MDNEELEEKLFDAHMDTMFNLIDELLEREELTEAENAFLDAFMDWNEFLDSQEGEK